MATSDALITGQFATNLFTRIKRRKLAHFDIFVQSGQGAQDLVEYMIKVEGYAESTKRTGPPSYIENVKEKAEVNPLRFPR